MNDSIHPLLRFSLCAILFLFVGMPATAADLPNPKAPEFSPSLQWLNVSRPLTLQELRGKVVILDFWTYGCINCMHVIPDLKRLEAKYGGKLAVIGVHSPKFENEKNLDTLRSIVIRYDLAHPVVNDTELTLWREYGIRAWPTLVLIDPDGGIVGGVSGEGHYDLLDKRIGELTTRFSAQLNTVPLPLAPEKGKAAPSLLAAPGKIAADRDWVAIADTLHHRVLLADAKGRIVQTFGGSTSALKDGSAAAARFASPQGLCFGNGGLYVADTGNHAIRFIDLARRMVTTVAGNGRKEWTTRGETKARAIGLNSPWDVACRDGTVYIAMAGSHQIWRLNTKTERIAPFAGSGREDIADGNLSEAAFSQPSGLSLAGHWLYVADAEDSAVRRIDLRPGKEKVETLIGTGLFDFGDRDGGFAGARLQHVLGVAALGENQILIVDTYNHKLKLLDLATRTVTSLAGSGKPGKGKNLNEPGGLAVFGGMVLIADTNNNRIVSYDPKAGRILDWPVSP